MESHQKRYFSRGLAAMTSDLENAIPIDAQLMIDLLNKALAQHGEIKEQIVHRDEKSLEMTGITSETFPIASALAYSLAGQIYGLVSFANASFAVGVRIKTPTKSFTKAAQVIENK